MKGDHTAERAGIVRAAEKLIADAANPPTVADLMRAAGVQRWILTHRHPDLMRAFQADVIRKWGDPSLQSNKTEVALKALQHKYTRLRDRAAELDRLVETYALALEELRVENKALRGRRERETLKLASNVTPLDRQR